MEGSELVIDSTEFEIIKSFNAHSVLYLIVGGYAMLFHGDNDRPVNDLDIWIDNNRENALKCFDALQNIAPGAFPFSAGCLAVRGKKIDLRKLHCEAEIFTSMDGADFPEAYARRVTFEQDAEQISVICALDLLKIKKLAHPECQERTEKEGKDIGFLESIINGDGS